MPNRQQLSMSYILNNLLIFWLVAGNHELSFWLFEPTRVEFLHCPHITNAPRLARAWGTHARTPMLLIATFEERSGIAATKRHGQVVWVPSLVPAHTLLHALINTPATLLSRERTL